MGGILRESSFRDPQWYRGGRSLAYAQETLISVRCSCRGRSAECPEMQQGGRLVRLTELVDLKGEAAAVSDRKAPGDNAVVKRVQVHFAGDHVDDVAGIGE